jgi:hypothetical protein
MDRSDRGAVVGEMPDIARSRRMSVRAGRYFVRGRATDALLEGEIEVPAGAELDVADNRLHRIAYARLVRKGQGVQSVAHGPEAGYFFHTPLGNADGLCQGAFAGYTVHLEPLSFGARVAGCHTGFSNAFLGGSTTEVGGELRAGHTWDLPVIGVDLGLAVGGWLFHQTFTTLGVAPARNSAAGSLALGLGLHVDLGKGFLVLEESALAAYVYPQEQQDGTTSLGPTFAFRQIVGFGKVW